MAVQIIEQSICSKNPDQKKCEDGLFVSSDFIAVIDGVTSKGKLMWPPSGEEDNQVHSGPADKGAWAFSSATGGRYAMEILTDALAGMKPGIDAASAIEYLNHSLTNAASSRFEYLQSHPEDRLMAVIIIYSVHRNEVWSFGDCQCLIGTDLYTHNKEIDDLMAQIRCLYNRAELILGCTEEELSEHDKGRDCILPLLRRQLSLANQDRPYGYDVLDGFTIRPGHVCIHPVPPQTQVILASDGYPVLMDTLAESEAKLEELIKKDPLCLNENKGTKGLVKGNRSFDDRTYIRFRVM